MKFFYLAIQNFVFYELVIIMQNKKSNIVLVGMAGSGKSTVGADLARILGLGFVDVDMLIEADQQAPLQDLLNDLGVQGFRNLEEKVILSIQYKNHVIATGGSAIYSDLGIAHLKRTAVLIFLDVALSILQQRIGDFSLRGLVKTKEQSFAQLYDERLPLYQKYADLVISCDDRSVASVCQLIKHKLSDTFYHF
jgi:shikimate kinase